MKRISFLCLLFAICLPIFSVAQSDAQNTPQTTNEDLFTIVEKMPEFSGGEGKLMEYLSKNIRYPEEAMKKNIQGTVYISFIVEKDGKVTNVELLRGIGGGCDEESVRVVAAMPHWKPGTQGGKPVRVQYRLPIRFTLQ